MSKKKSEKEAKEKKQSAKKAIGQAKAAPMSPGAAAVVELKEPKIRKSKAAVPRQKVVKAISNEDIALRAYFIAERRQKMGWHGDSTGDWVEAESQLKAEAAKKK
ncbi:MAG: DUF2934 domain-containing protein [Terrimicrobiaceae bacterium]|jgi:hypothetical protein|nr:DUF2934 domain-containing protein [Terrimicrobiaceae bacterium]